MPFKAVLFDLDGTLLDTIADLTESMNRSMASCGFGPRSVEECKVFVGDGVANFARRALPEGHKDDETVGRVVKRMREEYGKRWAERTRPYEGIPQLLDELTRRGVRMAVLSNKPQHFTQLMVAELLPSWKFEVVSGAVPEVAMKPDPAGAVATAERMGLAAREFLYVGDTDTDMQTAAAAGMYAVGALWGFRTGEELTRNGARVLIARPMELVGLL